MSLNTQKANQIKKNREAIKQKERLPNKADEAIARMSHSFENSSISTVAALSSEADVSDHTVKTNDKKEILDSKGNPDRGYGLNKDGTFKQSRAGRKIKEPKEKKVQIVLTIGPNISNRLMSWAESKPRSAANYLSMYIEDHLDEILSQIEGR